MASIEAQLKKDGIEVIAPLDTLMINSIAKSVSKQLCEAFPHENFTIDKLFMKLSRLPMYTASMPEGLAEANYLYKNSTIYFRDGLKQEELEKVAVHEFIHHLQESKDTKGNLIRLGLCTFTEFKVYGMALNEGAVQYMTARAIGENPDSVTYYGVTLPTDSPNYYPLLCSLISQMAYITGEDSLFNSTFYSNDNFKHRFIALCGEKTFYTVRENLDKILASEEKIMKQNHILQTKDMSISASQKLAASITKNKEKIKELYIRTQNLILISYFDSCYEKLYAASDIETYRSKLYQFQDLIGSVEGYSFFNNYYIDMMAKLDEKYDSLVNNTYLVVKKDSKLSKIMSAIRQLLFRKQEDYIGK